MKIAGPHEEGFKDRRQAQDLWSASPATLFEDFVILGVKMDLLMRGASDSWQTEGHLTPGSGMMPTWWEGSWTSYIGEPENKSESSEEASHRTVWDAPSKTSSFPGWDTERGSPSFTVWSISQAYSASKLQRSSADVGPGLSDDYAAKAPSRLGDHISMWISSATWSQWSCARSAA